MSELNLTHSNGNKVKLTTPDTLAASKTFKLPGIDGSSRDILTSITADMVKSYQCVVRNRFIMIVPG